MQDNLESTTNAAESAAQRRAAREQRVFLAAATMVQALRGLSNAEARDAMRMALSRYSMAPTPMVPAIMLTQGRTQVRAGPAPKTASKKRKRESTPNRSEELKEAMARLALLKKQIRTVSGGFPDGILPEGHELLQERDALLKIIKAQKLLEKSAPNKRRDDRPDADGPSAMQEAPNAL